MDKILKALDLQPNATEDDAVAEIEGLKKAVATKGVDAKMELAIQAKMRAGLSRATAMEAIANQAAEDAAVEKADKSSKKK
jgi:hypothetical protein